MKRTKGTKAKPKWYAVTCTMGMGQGTLRVLADGPKQAIAVATCEHLCRIGRSATLSKYQRSPKAQFGVVKK